MTAAGFSKYTEDYIKSEVDKKVETGDATNKTAAYSLFKSNPEVKRALSLGDLVEAKFDVIGINEKDNPKDTTVTIQEAYLILEKNGKPELRLSSRWYKKDGSTDLAAAPIVAGKSYKSKVNMGKGITVSLQPEPEAYEELDKPLFTPDQLLKLVALPVEEFAVGSTGMVWGTVGKKADKYLEISTDGSLLPLKIFPSDIDMSDIMEGDTIIACGYYGKNLNARYISRVEEPKPEMPKLGKI